MIDIDFILGEIKWPRKDCQFFSKGSIEEKINFSLPEDYTYFLSNYSGSESFLKNNYFVLWDDTELLSLNEAYEVQHHLPDTFAIGSNGGGEMIGLRKNEPNHYQIILISFGSMKDKDQERIIGDSFIDFLKRMHEGKNWFDPKSNNE